MYKKKITIISQHFPSKIDGVGDHSYQLAQRLFEQGNHINVLTAIPYQTENFKCYQSDLNGNKCLTQLNNIISELSPNILIFQYVAFSYHKKGLPFWLITFFKYLKQNNIKVILFVHETFERRRFKLKHILLEYLQKLILFRLCSLSNYVLTNNQLYLKHLIQFKKKTILTPTPSNFEDVEFHHKEKKNTKLNIAIFGERDHTLLLSLLLELCKLEQNIQFSFIGKVSKSLKSTLDNPKYIDILTRSYVTGILTQNEVIEHIADADFYMLPEQIIGKAKMGGLSTKSGSTATAFMLGKIVISTYGDMTDAMFKDMQNCVFIDPYDNKSNAIKILKVYRDSETKIKIEKNAKDLYETKLSWLHTINPIKEAINQP